ncbi:release factor glutamine methyltransferase [Hymenobacter daecheongensis DSM 21074]|uniref:peptide chain release factor N(5)-glutamine methyltransferase n=1 Tax=Hymenobacter daecheongensis DSM 21074 TaxID=1121955 RepID=A0A1M6IK91_9BACT|nr:peptide chain release factor N(5)-glutamine methyltransferase [Hymenobacter daecheongensis]SHJ34825.1 release factor glutamine methyltransferase [Hymenobacter daecheongensis DSM 21074]
MTVRQLTTDLGTALQAIYPGPEAAAIAALVVEHLLHLSPLQRRMQAAEPVPADVLNQVPPLQQRLLCHEPVQYVLGVAHFFGLELEVTPATLIPRPETEELVQLIINENKAQPNLSVLDVGTGSGCIPLALSMALRPEKALAVDISAEALAVARRNAARYDCTVEFAQLDILSQEPPGLTPASLAVLVSNPPYVLENERPLMRPNVLDYEPATALFVPDHDPLLFYRRIAELGRRYLRPGGGLYFEINEQYAAALVALLYGLGYQQVLPKADMFGKDRMLRATWPG